MSLDLDAHARLDLALVQRALQDDDRPAFEQLVRRHQGKVRAQLRQLCKGDHALADDLAQETFIQAWRALAQFRAQAKFSTWLYQVAHRCFLQAYRRQSHVEPTTDLERVAAEVEAEVAAAGAHYDIAKALARLPDGERIVLMYHAQLGLSHEETACVTGMALGTVKSHALRGKTRLRAWLHLYNPTSDTEKEHIDDQ